MKNTKKHIPITRIEKVLSEDVLFQWFDTAKSKGNRGLQHLVKRAYDGDKAALRVFARFFRDYHNTHTDGGVETKLVRLERGQSEWKGLYTFYVADNSDDPEDGLSAAEEHQDKFSTQEAALEAANKATLNKINVNPGKYPPGSTFIGYIMDLEADANGVYFTTYKNPEEGLVMEESVFINPYDVLRDMIARGELNPTETKKAQLYLDNIGL